MSPKTRVILGVIGLLCSIFMICCNSEWFTVSPYSSRTEWIFSGLVITAFVAMIVQAWIAIRRGKAAGEIEWPSVCGIMLGVGIVRLARTAPVTADYVMGGVLVAGALGVLLYIYLQSKKKDTKSEQ